MNFVRSREDQRQLASYLVPCRCSAVKKDFSVDSVKSKSFFHQYRVVVFSANEHPPQYFHLLLFCHSDKMSLNCKNVSFTFFLIFDLNAFNGIILGVHVAS